MILFPLYITPPNIKMFACFAAGNQEKVNQIAHAIDTTLLGPQKLSTSIQGSNGMIYFDLSATPNFKVRLEEAGVEVKPHTLMGRKAYRIVQKDAEQETVSAGF